MTNKGSLAESVTIDLIIIIYLFIIIIIIILNHFFPMTLGGYYMKNWKNKVGILKNKLFCGGKFPTLIMCPLDALELFCQCFTTVCVIRSFLDVFCLYEDLNLDPFDFYACGL